MTVDKVRGRAWGILLALGFGVSLVIMDATIVNVALPVVMTDLGLDGSQAQWLNASYALIFAALLVPVGRTADRYGRRTVFGIGMLVFMTASIAAGLSTSPGALIAARAIQGIGAALIVPSTLSILNATFRGQARTIAFAVWGSAIGGMAAVGPLIGGWLTTDASWRWAFWLNIPVGVLVMAGIVWFVPDSRDPDADSGADLVGLLTSALGMGAVVFGLIESSWYGWWRQDSGAWSPVPFALAGGLALLVGCWSVERHRAESGRTVLVDLSLFSIPAFRSGAFAALVVSLGEFGLLFTLPLLLQGTLGYSALGTGAVILALAMGTFLISAVLPRLSTRLDQRTIVQMGLFIEAASVATLAALLSLSISPATIALCLFGYGVGVGLATAQLTSLLLADVPPAASGQASGLQSSIRQLGAAFGVAILGGLLVTSLSHHTEENLTDAHLPPEQVQQLTTMVTDSAGVAIADLPGPVDDPTTPGAAAAAAMVTASRETTGAAAGVLLLGLLVTTTIPRHGEQHTARHDEATVTV